MGEIDNTHLLIERRRELRRGQTLCELIIWSLLRKRRLYGLKFQRQFSVSSYILDFHCGAKNLAIDIDGRQHAEPEAQEYDARRTAYLESLGMTVIRFWNEEVLHNCDDVIARICQVAGVGPGCDDGGSGGCSERCAEDHPLSHS